LTRKIRGVTLREVVFVLLVVASLAHSADAPAPALAQFEQRVVAALASRNDDATKAGLRREFQAVSEGLPPTPANQEVRGRILRLLGDGGSAAMLANASLAEGRRRYEARDYEGALAYANAILANDPSNASAVALRRLSEGRGRGSTATKAELPIEKADSPPASTRGSIVFTRLEKRAPVSVPGVGEVGGPTSNESYLRPGDTKRSWIMRKLDPWLNIALRLAHTTTAEEERKLAEAKKVLESTPSGRRLISDLGGWDEIGRTVDIRFAPIFAPRTNAYAAGAAGMGMIVLGTALLSEEAEVIAPILGHELSHVRDKNSGRFSSRLAIPSEFIAHREQIYVAQEMMSSLPPERIAALKGSNRWDYQRFLIELWRDRIVQRFPMKSDFVSIFENRDQQGRAKAAYDDLVGGKTAPGSAHVDHHLTAEETGVYTLLTDEKDILAIVRERGDRKISPSLKEEEDRLLHWRERMVAEMDIRDDEYRRAHGFTLE
jgi:hypothetical protein